MATLYKYSFVVIVVFLSLVIGVKAVSALTYSSDVGVQFTFNSTLEITLSSADLVISNLSPGTASDSNIIDVIVKTNNITGYTLNATVGNNTTYNTRNLVHELSGSSASFASINYGSSLANLTADNTWGYSYSTNDRTTWSNYDGLPIYSDATNIATLKEATSPSASIGDKVNFKIAAKASTTQASGEYNNVINFITIANPVPTLGPVACESGKICYNANAINPTDVEGTMGKPTVSANTATTLLASNFSREGYGFAGWSDTYDYTGNLYGPQEDITTPANMSNGLPLYAIWIPSAGSMQTGDTTSACNSLTPASSGFKSLASVSALTDERDGETYAIAKLADGKCWMIENLRLANTAAHNSDGTLAQGYNSRFVGLADPEEPLLFYDSTTANTIYSIDGSTSKTISGSNQAYRFPRYNNLNTPINESYRPENPTSNTFAWDDTTVGMYSYGNYYTWAAAIADTTDYSSGNHNSTSICPTGWRIPTGKNTGEFYNLNTAVNSGATDANASNILRGYPYNFIYSGFVVSSSVYDRGSAGDYWSSTAYADTGAHYFALRSSNFAPGTAGYAKYYGRSIRCLASGT